MLNSMDKLIDLAIEARGKAYSKYSNFPVGAAVLCADGSVYTGANIENASYGLTVCAERVAIFKAVSEGKRSFSAIAVCCGVDKPENAVPCGACLQVMSEFFESDATIIACLPDRRYKEYGLSKLFPHGFKLG
ncbi:MAG TPA: cytidine deaminase [Firmicutes bacterium]|nr:cytidine deaminase [Bacillota bacterium]